MTKRVHIEDLIPGRRYRDMDGETGIWGGELFVMDPKEGTNGKTWTFKPIKDGGYDTAGWVDIADEMTNLRRRFCEQFDFSNHRLDQEGYLDEMVQDAKAEEAAAINNEGLEAQLRYLLGEE